MHFQVKEQNKDKEPGTERKIKPKTPPTAVFEQKLTFFMKRAEAKHIDLRRQQKKKQGIVKKQKKR